MRFAFIGPGTMGRGMAMNLAAEQPDCLIIGRRKESLAPFQERSIPTSTSVYDAADYDITFLCLRDEADVCGLLLGEDSPAFCRGQIIVDCSTVNYRTARKLASYWESRGVAYLDAPVSGFKRKAEDGTLRIFCGGKRESFEAVKPLLSRMGEPVYMGPSGAGQLTKMINNCALNICAASFCELMPLGVAEGLDAEALGEVLCTATGSSYASRTLIPEILSGNFSYDFTMESAYKDIRSLEELLKEKELELPAFNGMKETYERALREGYGSLYKGAMIRPYEEQLGILCRKELPDA